MKIFKYQPSPVRSWVQAVGRLLLIFVPILLLWWALRQVPLTQVWDALRGLNVLQIGLWLVVNILLMILMSGRWWLILRTLGHPLPYLALTRYRMAAFAVSYFTPGPQFGGEPLQVWALRKKHQVSAKTGTASVGLDKLLELIANFSFLVIGIAIALVGAWLPSQWRVLGLAFAVGLLVFPLAYLILMLAGRRPLNELIGTLPQFIKKSRFSVILQEVEVEMSDFCVTQPRAVMLATLISIGVWVGMVFEYWLLIRFLSLRLSLLQAVSAMVAARLAFLTPLPAGLGALEVSQVMAVQSLGVDPAYGLGISLFIRCRDILFGLVGLVGAVTLWGWQCSPKVRNHKDV